MITIRTRISFRALFVIAGVSGVLALTSAPASAVTRFWRDAVVSGNWDAASNWSTTSAAGPGTADGGVPALFDPVRIVHTSGPAHTVTLSVSPPTVGLLSIDHTTAGTTDTLLIPSNVSLTAAAMFVGGHNGVAATSGRGSVNQSAGSVAMTSGADLVIAHGIGSTGGYTLSGGSLTATQSEFIGFNGNGTFNHSGGVNTINEGSIGALDIGTLPPGSGIYNLSGTGQLISNKSVYIGDQGTGAFNQTGGTHIINGDDDLYLGWAVTGVGAYTISGTAALTVGDDVTVGLDGAGSLNIQGQASVYVGDRLNIGAADTLIMSGGTLRLANLTRNATGTISYSGGAIRVSDGAWTTDSLIQEFFGASPTIPTGKTLAFEGNAGINGNVAVNGGAINFLNTIPDSYNTVGAGNGAGSLSISNGGDVVVTNNSLSVGELETGNGTGTLSISGVGSTLTTAGLGVVRGSIAINNGAVVTNSGSFGAASFNLIQSSTTVTGVGTNWTNSGGMDINDTSLSISSGAVVSANGVGVIADGYGAGSATVTGAGSTWNLGSNLTLGSLPAFGNGVGTVTAENGATVSVGGQLTIVNSASSVNVINATLRVGSIEANSLSRVQFNSGTMQLTGNRTIGADAIVTHFFGANALVPAGKTLAIEGVATLQNPVAIDGGALRAGSLVVNNTFQFKGGVLEVTGGPISGLASLVVPSGGEFRASGTHSLVVAGNIGSTITATGNLTLGNISAVNGFGTQGNVQVGANTLTLLDANDVVLDSLALATLGNGVSPGTLNAANGLTVDFGGNITGFGTVSTLNNAAKPFINNGHIVGDSPANRITLPGYVKGVGTLDNVNVTGTLAPGFSPAILSAGNLSFLPSSTLVMELGGITPGSQYDQIQASGQLSLDGELQIALINGFTPTAGQSFNLFDWATRSGAFSTLSFPPLSGLLWDTSQLYTAGVLSVAAAPSFLEADFDEDGDVDGDDLTRWRTGFGSGVTHMQGNSDADGDVDGDDFLAWQRQLGFDSALVNAAVIPEPEAFLLVAMSLLVLGGATARGLARRRS